MTATTTPTATANFGMNTVKVDKMLANISICLINGIPAMFTVTTGELIPAMNPVSTPTLTAVPTPAKIEATKTAPAPVFVEPPKAEVLVTSERDVLLAKHKELFGNNKGMGKSSVEHLKKKIAEKTGTPVAPPAAKVEAPKVEVAPPAPTAKPKAGGGGKPSSSGKEMPQVIRNTNGVNTATYKCNPKPNKPQKFMTVYLMEKKGDKYKVFSPAKDQKVEGLMPGFMIGSEWWADASKIS